MKIFVLASLLTLLAHASPLNHMIRLDENETVTQICASKDVFVVSTSLRIPFRESKTIELEPTAKFLVFAKERLIGGASLGRGVVRSLLKMNEGFICAKSTADALGQLSSEFFLITDQGSFTKLPSLPIDLVGVLVDNNGSVIAYGSSDVWKLALDLPVKEWCRLAVNPELTRGPIRSIVKLEDEHYVVLTNSAIYGLTSISGDPVWESSYEGQFVSAIGADKCWILTSDEKGAKVGYLENLHGNMQPFGEIPNTAALKLLTNGSELFIFTSGRDAENAKRKLYTLDRTKETIMGPVVLPDRTRVVCIKADEFIYANNLNEIYLERFRLQQ